MDTKKTGTFICILRKQKGLTQSRLAEIIGVTDKAVSRWETGKGFPDVSLLQPLAEALGTSVTELLAGEPLTAEEKAARSDGALLEALRYTGRMGKPVLSALLAAAGGFLLLLPLFMAGGAVGVRLAGVVLLALAFLTSRRKKLPVPAFLSPLVRPAAARAGTALCLLAALVLECLPWGAVLNFARPASDGSIGRFRETYSYFSLMPVGYGMFFPMLTGVLTAALLAAALLQWRRPRKKRGDRLFVAQAVALVCSLMPLALFGPDFFSAVGGLVSLSLLLSLVFMALANRDLKKEEVFLEKKVDFPENN